MIYSFLSLLGIPSSTGAFSIILKIMHLLIQIHFSQFYVALRKYKHFGFSICNTGMEKNHQSL